MGGEGASNGRTINQVATGTKLKSKTGGKERGATEDMVLCVQANEDLQATRL